MIVKWNEESRTLPVAKQGNKTWISDPNYAKHVDTRKSKWRYIF